MSIVKLTYGRTPENPIQVNGVQAELAFLRELVTENGFKLVYHRVRSLSIGDSKPIDHYEIFTAEGKYDDLFFNIYNDTNKFIPPQGYLFENRIYLNSQNEMEEKYIYKFDVDIDMKDREAVKALVRTYPPLSRFISLNNVGANFKLDNFPYTVIDKMLKDRGIKGQNKKKEIYALIPKRKQE